MKTGETADNLRLTLSASYGQASYLRRRFASETPPSAEIALPLF